MFIIVGTLLVLQEASKETADKIQAFFNPALNWIQRWLPLFYVPTLVVLPVAIQGIQGGCLSQATAPRCYSGAPSIVILLASCMLLPWSCSSQMPNLKDQASDCTVYVLGQQRHASEGLIPGPSED